jgi:hypothetical protein
MSRYFFSWYEYMVPVTVHKLLAATGELISKLETITYPTA